MLFVRVMLVLVLPALLLAGCGGGGGSGKPTARVTGMVTIDSKPLETGTINFIPAAKDQAPAASATITAGKYSIDSPIGKVRVMFVATQKTGKKIPGSSEPIDEVISVIPDKFAQGVEIDVPAAGGPQDFALAK